MARVFLFILDSFGIGHAPDAAQFGDEGANTLLHICDRMSLRLPHMASLGLGLAAEAAGGRNPFPDAALIGRWGHAQEVSQGKDTITGHWEIAGVPVPFKWHYYPDTAASFPTTLLDEIIARAKIPGLLCGTHASGTQVIEDFGEDLEVASKYLDRFYRGKFLGAPVIDRAVGFSARHAGFRRVMARALGGEQSYLTLKRDLIANALRFV